MMKLNFKFATLFVLAALLFSSCEEDLVTGGGTETDIPPSISLISEAGFVADDATINVGESIKVKVDVRPGSSDLKSLTIFEDGSKLALDRLDGVAGNAVLIAGTNKGGATYEIEILPDPSVTAESVFTYAFELEDDLGQTATISFIVTTDIPFTSISTSITGALFNQSGPSGKGGLDLDDGTSTGSSDDRAELQDEGIDNGASSVAANWRRQLSGANGAEVVFIDDLSKIIEGLTFADVEYLEQITAAFAAGTALDGDDSNCDCTDSVNDEAVSQPVNVGDLFAISRDGRTYLIECTAVNVTENDNNDNYEFNIKY